MIMLNFKDIALLMALPSESQKAFEKENIPVIYTGIGKVNASFKATEVILQKKPKVVINLGTAGSNKFQTHDLIECSGFVQRDMDLSPLGFPLGETPLDPIPGLIHAEKLICTDLKSGVCGTGDGFEVGKSRLNCDLVDMEAYAIAKVCKINKVTFHSFKYITDGSDENAHKDWVGNLVPAANALLNLYKKLVQFQK
jgi:adenosylhomocysteine nucleosidase